MFFLVSMANATAWAAGIPSQDHVFEQEILELARMKLTQATQFCDSSDDMNELPYELCFQLGGPICDNVLRSVIPSNMRAEAFWQQLVAAPSFDSRACDKEGPRNAYSLVLCYGMSVGDETCLRLVISALSGITDQEFAGAERLSFARFGSCERSAVCWSVLHALSSFPYRQEKCNLLHALVAGWHERRLAAEIAEAFNDVVIYPISQETATICPDDVAEAALLALIRAGDERVLGTLIALFAEDQKLLANCSWFWLYVSQFPRSLNHEDLVRIAMSENSNAADAAYVILAKDYPSIWLHVFGGSLRPPNVSGLALWLAERVALESDSREQIAGSLKDYWSKEEGNPKPEDWAYVYDLGCLIQGEAVRGIIDAAAGTEDPATILHLAGHVRANSTVLGNALKSGEAGVLLGGLCRGVFASNERCLPESIIGFIAGMPDSNTIEGELRTLIDGYRDFDTDRQIAVLALLARYGRTKLRDLAHEGLLSAQEQVAVTSLFYLPMASSEACESCRKALTSKKRPLQIAALWTVSRLHLGDSSSLFTGQSGAATTTNRVEYYRLEELLTSRNEDIDVSALAVFTAARFGQDAHDVLLTALESQYPRVSLIAAYCIIASTKSSAERAELLSPANLPGAPKPKVPWNCNESQTCSTEARSHSLVTLPIFENMFQETQ